MNNKIIGIVLAGLIIGGGVLFTVMGGDDDTASNNQSSEQAADASDNSATANILNIDTAALTGSYRLNISSNDGGQQLEGVFELDGNGNIRTDITVDGQRSGFVQIDGNTYVQNPEDGSWVLYPANSPAAPSVNIDELALSNEDINEITDDTTIEELGEQPCDAGTCRVYRDTDETTMEVALIKIDVATNRISEVELSVEETGTKTTLIYTYPDDISIVAPEGATEFVIPEIPDLPQ